MLFRQIYDDKLAQYAYLVGCQQTKEALIIDPERDIDRYIRIAESEGLTITAVAETHIHADFLSGARAFAHDHGVQVYLSAEGDPDWQYTWAGAYGATLLRHRDIFRLGNVRIEAVHTPGHTPEHLSFLITDLGAGANAPMGIVTGDFVFVGDVGRPDLLETAAGRSGTMRASARRLYTSVMDFLNLQDYLQVWPGHGAGSACGKAIGAVPETTVGYERRFSPAMQAAETGEDRFVEYILANQPEPPLYFARMKQLNKEGPPLLDELPHPCPLSTDNVDELAGEEQATIIDTREDRRAFMRGHLAGSLHAPLDRSFLTVAGSYVRQDEKIYLVVEQERLNEAVRSLIRIGLDRIAGYVTPNTLQMYRQLGGMLASTEIIDFHALERLRDRPGTRVIDVRREDEFAAGHVPGAQHVPHTRLLERLNEVSDTDTLLVHCATGSRAAAATALLERHGHRAVLVDDRFSTWRELSQQEAAADAT